jgi:predicted methyltransferase/dienelactone hydrolase
MTRTTLLISCALLAAYGCGGAETTPPAQPPTTGAEAPPAGPDVVGEEVTYQAGGTTLKGYIAWDRAKPGKRPGIVVVHEWWGHNDYVRKRAEMLAELGYTALAVDMFGDGKNTQHPAEAQAFMQASMADPAGAKARFEAGLAVLRAHDTTDPERIAAIGYCFGGAVVLSMARAGVDLDLIGSFHGILATKTPAAPGAVRPRLFVATGAADPMVPADQVEAFRQEMDQAGALYEVLSYPGAMHAFTNPASTAVGQANKIPLAYDAAADADSWTRFTELLHVTFSAPEPTAEQKQQAVEAAKARGELARMEAEAKVEEARWTEALHAEAKKLAETKHTNLRTALKKIMASAHRVPGNAERDPQRHAVETLGFFGLKPNMTVFEYGPGAGWYTELLAPLLAARGRLLVNNGNPDGAPEDRGTLYARRFKHFLDKAPELYGKVETIRVDDAAKPSLGLDGTLDMALVIRGFHGWKRRDIAGVWLAELHEALKPGGVLGIVQHRAPEGTDPKAAAEKGRLPQQALIDEVQAAGFKLVKKSEVNANPKDKGGYPEGVWTLPPTLRLGDTDRDKYLAIGESDRMTLKFVKVAKAPPAAAKPAAANPASTKPAPPAAAPGAVEAAKKPAPPKAAAPAAPPAAPAAKPAAPAAASAGAATKPAQPPAKP